MHGGHCDSAITVGALTASKPGCSPSVPAEDPAFPAGRSAPPADIARTHQDGLDSGAARDGPVTHVLSSPAAPSSSHHPAQPTKGTAKNGSRTVHVVFTQAGTEGRDAHVGANLQDAGDAPGEHALSDVTDETTDTSITSHDGTVHIVFGNIRAARAHQFTSSL